jgi:hypothetical protein
MATKLHFCPQCETLLMYVTTPDASALTALKCTNCTYQTIVPSKQTIKTSIYGGTNLSATITKAAVYDPTLRRSCTIVCQNAKCDSNDLKKLGTYNDEGRLIQPEVCVTNHTSINRVNTYICRICRTIFT